jgi:putative zinc finger/helix-turn-helix YgiT family protein
MEKKCRLCGGNTHIVRHDYRFTESGLGNVVLKDVEFAKCDECGEEAIRIPRLNHLLRALALGVIAKPYELTGEELRFLRKYLGLSATEFASILSVDKSTLSRWENGDQPLGSQSDRLVRTVVLGLGEGMKEKLEQTIRSFPEIRKTNKPVRLDVYPETKEIRYRVA